MAILKTEGLTYVYSAGTPFEKTAIDNINLCIEENCMIGVIGHTGSGKSTLIQHFNGLLQPTSGKIYLENRDIWEDKSKLRDVRFQVGLVFQYPEYQLFEETVFRDIAFGVKNMNLGESEIKTRVLETAQMLGIENNLLNRSPFALSGGQKRRVAIAGVMAMRPKILILDDSTTSSKMLRGILEDAGMEVIGEASNGQEALILYTSLKPDVVTLDITMPVMDGINALKELMALDKTARVVMVTAAGQKGNVVEALKIGAKEFVAKPYEVDLIIDVIKKAME